MILREALLAEVFDSIVVCVCQKVVQFFRLCVVLQLVHETRAVTLNLLLRRDGQEDDLSELLRVKGPKDASAQDLRLLPLLSLDNDHSFVHTVHHEAHDIGSRHARQLFRDDILQVNQVAHILESPIDQRE